MSYAFVFKDLACEQDSGIGLPDLIVRAFDKDLKYDDLMGGACTGCDGSFCTASRAADFRDFFDKGPDIYLGILVPAATDAAPREVWNTRHAVRWNAGHLEYIVVELPHAVCQRLPDGGHGGGHLPSTGCCDHQSHKPCPATPITRCRDIYLRIEELRAYSPVAPDDAEHDRYRRDCMRNDTHEDTCIPESEVDRRRLDALVYREYLDAGYTVPKTDPLVPADINEPPAGRRIPGTVIYAEPGERLFVHVCNADDDPHSLHVHGLLYGIDSDGSWPFGVHDVGGQRSDAICPGQTWCYVFDVTEETIGAWPFYDYHRHITEAVNRGLFGGIVVRDTRCPQPDYEVALFFHRLVPERGEAMFDSGSLDSGETFPHTFMAEGTYHYRCRFHPMSGVVHVMAAGPLAANATILDGPGRFDPADIPIGVGGTVTWTHAAAELHTVTDTGGTGLESFAFNGRTFVGNTPTIVARSGKRIRWYVFNLDLSAGWHNFHVHGQRWRVGEEIIDSRSLGPAGSFVADTIVPHVVLLPLEDCGAQKEQRRDEDCDGGERLGRKRLQLPMRPGVRGMVAGHGGMAMPGGVSPTLGPVGHIGTSLAVGRSAHPGERRSVRLSGDFLIHCDVEMHMMQGMAAVVRAVQDVDLTPEIESALGFELPLPTGDTCPDVLFPPHVRAGGGTWERLPDPPIFVVHAAMLHTGRVLLWSGGAEVGYPLISLLWDPANPTDMTQTQSYSEDLFCSGHAWLADGRLCVAGGYVAGMCRHSRATFLFDPAAATPWARVADMGTVRWCPTLLTLSDGSILAASGMGATSIEIFDGTAWNEVMGASRGFSELYPSLNLLPSGQIFYSRAGWRDADMVQTETAYLSLTGPLTGTWTDLGQQQFYDRQEGTAVMQIDATVSPPVAKVFIIGGGVSGPATGRNPQSL